MKEFIDSKKVQFFITGVIVFNAIILGLTACSGITENQMRILDYLDEGVYNKLCK